MLYDKIRRFCKEIGISVIKLEEETELARGSISKWDKLSPTARSLKKVADYLGTTVDELLTETGEVTIGQRIKALRAKENIRQIDFAERIGVSKQTLFKYENNIITNIPYDKIEAAAAILHVSPAFLMGWNDKEIAECAEIAIDELLDEDNEAEEQMSGFTTEELSLILIMSSIAMVSGKVKFDETFLSVQRKVTDEICRRTMENGKGEKHERFSCSEF